MLPIWSAESLTQSQHGAVQPAILPATVASARDFAAVSLFFCSIYGATWGLLSALDLAWIENS